MTWTVRQSDLPQNGDQYFGTLFCVGNGTTTTRGTACDAGLSAYRAAFISGCMTRAGYGLGYYFGAADWTWTQVAQGGKALEAKAVDRSLDLHQGVLTTTTTYEGGIQLVEERFASWADSALHGQRLVLTIPEQTTEVSLRCGLDGDVPNHVAKYYAQEELPNRDGWGVRLGKTERCEGADGLLTLVRYSPATGARTATLAKVVGLAETQVNGDTTFAAGVFGPGTHTVTKLALFDGDKAFHGPVTEHLLPWGRELSGLQYAQARAAHTRSVADFWDCADVAISGNDEDQLAVRYALWSTRIAAPLDDGASSVGAKNLTGDWYRGAVFWDMEMFQLPLLTAVAPDRARNHLLYRAKRLNAARTLAAQDGYDGARFPWQSYVTGLEEPPAIGGFLYQQQHVSLAVAWGFLYYHACSGDDRIMVDDGLEVVLEVCRFAASRLSLGEDGKYHLIGITGPDEDHRPIDDDVYTAFLMRYLLGRAGQLVADIRSADAQGVEDICRRLGVSDETFKEWQVLSGKVAVEHTRTGALAQYAGYEQVPEPDETLMGQYGLRSDKPTKQAAVLTLWQALPTQFNDDDLTLNWREHAPICNNASSLSFCTHALLAARLGYARDFEKFFDFAKGIDLDDSAGNAEVGAHGAGEAGIWMAAVQGCGGLRIGHDRVIIEPALPPRWENLRYRVTIAGCPLTVNVNRDQVTVANAGTNPVNVVLAGHPVTIAGGDEVTKEYRKDWVENELEGVAFDLDGVLVTTDAYHYRAWKELADEVGLHFDEQINHRLRGVSRQQSLRRIYEANDRELPDAATFEAQCTQKNEVYKKLIGEIGEHDILPGAVDLLKSLKAAGIKTVLASASRNAPAVLKGTGLDQYIDAIADGNIVTASKPDPQVFYLAAQRIRVMPWNCLGVEDAHAGVQAIHRAGMVAVGIGDDATNGDHHVSSTADISVNLLKQVFKEQRCETNPYKERSVSRTKEDVDLGYDKALSA